MIDPENILLIDPGNILLTDSICSNDYILILFFLLSEDSEDHLNIFLDSSCKLGQERYA